MRGSIYKRKLKRDGRTVWDIVVRVEGDDGKPHQVWRRGFATRREAEAELGRVLHRAGEGGDPFPKRMTVREYLQKWLASSDQRLRGSTARRYRQLLALYVIPVIGGLQLSAVKPAHVREVLDRVTAAGRSARTAVQTRAVLRSALRQAVEDGLISVNPVTSVKPPKPERPRLEVLTGQHLSRLLTESKGTVWEIPMLFAACTGARRSEVLGLRWTDVDLANGRVRITRGLQRVADDAGNRVLRFLDLKTDRARRTVHLQPFAVERLKQLRAEQAERRLMLGSGWTDLDLVCEAGDGTPLDPDAFTHGFKRLARRVGLPAGVRLHDVRHGVATAMLERGVHPGIASAALGHSSPAFTMSVYQHVLDGMGAVAADAIEQALGGVDQPS